MFQISKNKMSFVTDNKAISKELTTTTDKIVAKSSTHLLDTVNYSAEDAIYHATFQFRAYLPNLQIANFPNNFNVVTNDTFEDICVISLQDYYVLGFVAISSTTPITSIKLNVTSQPNADFIIPANSVINYGILPNESIVSTSNIPTPPSLPDRFVGLADFLDGAVIHPEFPDLFMGFKGNNIYYQSISSESKHAEGGSISSVFPEVTGTVKYVHRSGLKGVNSDGHNIYWQIYIYNTNLDYFRYEYSGGAIDNFTFLATGNHSWEDYTANAYDWQLVFKNDGGVQKVDAVGNTGNFQPYGPGTSLYPTLPNTSPVTAVVNDQVNNRVIAMIDSTMYILTGSPENSVTDSWTYG